MASMKSSRLLIAFGTLLVIASVVASAPAAERFSRLFDSGPELLPPPVPAPMPQTYSPSQKYAAPYQTTPLQKAFLPYQKSMVPYQKPVIAYQQPCCDQRKITYRKHRLLKRVCCDPCLPSVNMVLQVMDPCTGCPVDVPVCVPGCCASLPAICPRKGLFGCPITDFNWCCGYRIRIVMKRNGDLIVHSYGS